MPSPTANSKIIQIQVPNALVDTLDQISSRTHVPRAHLIRMGIEKVVDMINKGEIGIGISYTPSTHTGAPPPPAFSVGDPTGMNR